MQSKREEQSHTKIKIPQKQLANVIWTKNADGESFRSSHVLGNPFKELLKTERGNFEIAASSQTSKRRKYI